MQAELILAARAALGEGALWHEERLLWVDIDGCAVHRFNPANGHNETWNLGQRVGTVVPRSGGGLLVAAHLGIGTLDPASGALKIFVDPENGRVDLRFNDGKCDPRGRFFAGTMGVEKPRPPGSLYRVDRDRQVTRVLSDVGTSNGLAWSHDEQTMYFIDTPTMEVSAFDYDATSGAISNRRAAVKFAPGAGRPDGMTIDADGNLWVAMYDGGCVQGCDPRTGRVFARIEVAASRTTSCAFGGPGLRDLYITSAGGKDEELRAREPLAGGLFVARPGVRGVTAFAFAG